MVDHRKQRVLGCPENDNGDGRNEYLPFSQPFDDSLDDYVDFYACYVMPVLSTEELEGTWVGLENRALDRLPNVPLNELPFELPRRG